MRSGPARWIWAGLLLGLLAFASREAPVAAASKPSFYRIDRSGDAWWLVSPEGRRFFSLGVNVVDRGADARDYRPDRPEFAAFRYYPDPESWAAATLRRLGEWNFNTLGAWCDLDALRKGRGETLPYTVVLYAGKAVDIPWGDLFSDDAAKRIDEEVRGSIQPYKGDPRLIGYFTDNEIGWWDDTLVVYHLQQPDSATRRVLVDILRRRYGGDFERLRRDWETGEAREFSDLERPARLRLKPGGGGHAVVDDFAFLLAQRYYHLVHDAVRHYDREHLILGDRYQSWYSPAVARAAGPYVDAVSTNYKADWLDGSVARYYFETLYRLTRKPLLVTEYYFAARQNRSGNKNTGEGFPTVETQAERAAAFRTSLSAFARMPYVVGAHWFQYYDEPPSGRPDDMEDFNMGLVDIEDRPYEELTSAAARLQAEVPDLHRHARSPLDPVPDARGAIPSAPADPGAGLYAWDKPRAFVPPTSRLPGADLYACWDEGTLYLALHTQDSADPELYPGDRFPDEERPSWTVSLGGAKLPLKVRFGRSGKAETEVPAVTVRERTDAPRYTVLLSIPASLIVRDRLGVGDSLRLRSSLSLPGRAATVWERTVRLDPER